MIRALLAAALALGGLAPAAAQDFPTLSGRVVDAANIIPDDQEAQLTQELAAHEAAKRQQFVVATVPSLQGYTIEDYGYRLGRAWGIGRKGVDDGVILLVAPAERKVRIEVGYGLTPVLTAQLSGLIVRETILPRFRDGDMPGGIRAGADAILEQLRLPAPEAEARAQRVVAEQDEARGGVNWIALAFWIIVILVILIPLLRRAAGGKKYRRGRTPVVIWGPGWGGGGSSWGGGGSSWGGGSWGGGGGGGGFSGGGGSFGGGGASGGW